MNILIVGLSHKTAPVETREKMSIPTAKMETAIAHLCSYPHIQEAAILSTCNRLEIYTVVHETKPAVQEVIDFLCQHSQLPYQQLHRHLFMLMQQEASTHLMQVASGLDSLVLGEGQILAQVKHSYKLAQQYGGSKIILNQLFQRAITTAKRVRTETKIGRGAVSVSSVAVELAQTKVENLAACRVAVIGAGKMARRLVQHLLAKRVSQIAIVNRSLERAKELANQFGEAHLRCYPLEVMSSIVTASDLVFTSTAATEPLLNYATLTATLADNQPLMLFDISVPRNVSVDAENLPSVQVFNVDDLQSIVAQNQENRRQMVQKAQLIIEKELDAFCLWLRSRETVPVIKCLREKAEVIRQRELEKTMPRLSAEFTQKHQKAVEALTRAIVNKILHEPLIHLQSQPDLEAQRLAVEMLQMLFDLESCVISRVQQPTP